jgi:hypothetical protein
MAELGALQQVRETVVQYIDRAKALRDQFDDLDMKTSLPLLNHQFIRGLNDELRSTCAPLLSSYFKNMMLIWMLSQMNCAIFICY